MVIAVVISMVIAVVISMVVAVVISMMFYLNNRIWGRIFDPLSPLKGRHGRQQPDQTECPYPDYVYSVSSDISLAKEENGYKRNRRDERDNESVF
jgi:uncharacterized membrane protein